MDSLVLWLRADTGIVLDDQGRISGWSDVRGNGPSLTQTDASKRPSRTTDSTLNLPILTLNPGWMEFTQSLTIGTLLVVARHRGASFMQQEGLFTGPDGDTYFYFTGKKSTSGSAPTWMADSSSYLKRRFRDGLEITGGVLDKIDQWHLYSGVDTTSDATKRTRNKLYIGRDRSNTSYLWSGEVLEIIVYSAALSDDNRKAVQSAVMSRYNIIAAG